jgi:hypothetical protein
VVLILVGVLGFASPTMFGLIPHGYNAFDDLLHLVLGGLSLAVAWWFFGAERGTRTQNQAGRDGELWKPRPSSCALAAYSPSCLENRCSPKLA